MNNRQYIYILFAVLLSSCTKVIQLDLKQIDSKIVIEGNITDDGNPAEIHISKTKDFYSSNDQDMVTGATVTVSDNTGTQYVLSEVSAGVYQNTSLVGVAGNTYTMNVSYANQTYQASSTMPNPILLDTIEVLKTSFGGGQNLISPRYQDPKGIQNFYLLRLNKTGSTVVDFASRDDKLTDGVKTSEPIFGSVKIDVGDTAIIELQCIDKPVFTFWRTLEEASSGNTVPDNPTSNISNKAVGYFSAHTVSKKWVVIR